MANLDSCERQLTSKEAIRLSKALDAAYGFQQKVWSMSTEGEFDPLKNAYSGEVDHDSVLKPIIIPGHVDHARSEATLACFTAVRLSFSRRLLSDLYSVA